MCYTQTRGSLIASPEDEMEPVIYFRRKDGHIFLAPYSSFPTPPGCDREGADTLYKVHELEKRLVSQEQEQWEKEANLDAAKFTAHVDEIKDRMYTRMCSGSTDPYEKDFIREWLKLRDEKKRAKYAGIFSQRTAYLHALHFDTPKDRRVDEEKVNLDRINL